MAVQAGVNVNPIQDMSTIFRMMLDGSNFLISIGSTAAHKLTELSKLVKHEMAAKTLGEGGEMTLPELKKLLNDVSAGQDTFCTMNLRVDQMDTFAMYAKRNGLAYSTAGDYRTDNNTVCITYPGSQKALLDVVLQQGKLDVLDKSECGTPEKMEEILSSYDNAKDITIPDIEANLTNWNKSNFHDLTTAQNQQETYMVYLEKRADHFKIQNLSDPDKEGSANYMFPKDPSSWKKESLKFRTDKFKDPAQFEKLLQSNKGIDFRNLDRSQLSYFTLKQAVKLDPMNLAYFGSKELKILKDYDNGHHDSVKFKNSSNSYYEWSKAALLQTPTLFPYLQGGTIGHTAQHSFTLASIACLGGECQIDAEGKTAFNRSAIKGRGDPRMFEFVKLNPVEMHALGKALIDKDPCFAGIVLKKCPTKEMFAYALETFSKPGGILHGYLSQDPETKKWKTNFFEKKGVTSELKPELKDSFRAKVLIETITKCQGEKGWITTAEREGVDGFGRQMNPGKIRQMKEETLKSITDFIQEKKDQRDERKAAKENIDPTQQKDMDYSGFEKVADSLLRTVEDKTDKEAR